MESLIARLTIPIFLEGHVTHPGEMRQALDMGATAVVVGSAITRPQTITARFVNELLRQNQQRSIVTHFGGHSIVVVGTRIEALYRSPR